MIESRVSTNPRILYIDKDRNSSNLMKRILEADGFSVSLASNVLKGLLLARVECPDLILLDIDMPGLNGYEITRRLRRIEHTRDTPIIVVSSSCDPKARTLNAQAGCNYYIIKPIDVDRIAEQIGTFL